MAVNNADIPAPPSRPMETWQIITLGIGFVVLAVLMAYLLVALWPERILDDKGKDGAWDSTATLFGKSFSVRFEARLILLVIVASALGSYVHGATSFATYVGNGTLLTSWVWWYILRTPIGISLALIFYLVLRGGLLSAGAAGEVLSPFGVAAIAGLVGMFSKQATDKLRELFDNLFRTAPGRGDDERKDKPEERPPNPVPMLADIEPNSIAHGGAEAALNLTGSDFVRNSVAQVNGSDRRTGFTSDTRLTAYLKRDDLAKEGQLTLTVVNPPPGGGMSSSVTITVT